MNIDNFPTHWEICGNCQGDGSLYLGGRGFVISEEDRADPDFCEAYHSGWYDQNCVDCDGTGKIRVVDEDLLSDEQREEWESWHRDYVWHEGRWVDRIQLSEMRMGA